MMLRAAILLTIFAGFLSSVFSQVDPAAVTNDPSKRVFEIPVYPGTVPYNTNPRFERWHAPFGTSLRVYRTADGGPLDKEKVISFYKDALANKGWKDHTFERRGDEGYLGLKINLLVDLPHKTRAHIAGTFYMWVAPRDGMYTILLDQWRYTSHSSEAAGSITTFDASIESIGAKRGYRVQRVYSDDEWARDFENEFLIDRVRFSFHAKEAIGPHPRDDQWISLTILTYRDNAIAEYEARRFVPSTITEPHVSPEGIVNLPLRSRTITQVVVKDSTAFLIQDSSGKQDETVKFIAAELQKL